MLINQLVVESAVRGQLLEPKSVGVSELVLQRNRELAERNAQIQAALHRLTSKESYTLMLSFGLFGWTQYRDEEIFSRTCLFETVEEISVIRNQAIAKLKSDDEVKKTLEQYH